MPISEIHVTFAARASCILVEGRPCRVPRLPARSLLLRLCDSADHEAWVEFVTLYEPAIYRALRRHGLQDADARDMMQELLLAISRSIDRWEPGKQARLLPRLAAAGRPQPGYRLAAATRAANGSGGGRIGIALGRPARGRRGFRRIRPRGPPRPVLSGRTARAGRSPARDVGGLLANGRRWQAGGRRCGGAGNNRRRRPRRPLPCPRPRPCGYRPMGEGRMTTEAAGWHVPELRAKGVSFPYVPRPSQAQGRATRASQAGEIRNGHPLFT